MSGKRKVSPQEWLDCQLKGLAGYSDPDNLKKMQVEVDSCIRWNAFKIDEYRLEEKSGYDRSKEIQERQEEFEWAIDLKLLIEKMIESAPDLPVLPPPDPLIKLTGTIKEIEYIKAIACFDAEAYSTMKDKMARQRENDDIGVAVTMIAQTISGVAPHAMSGISKSDKLKCLFIKGKIDGKSFSGWFGMTNLEVGDKVEMAAMPDGEGYLVYAVINVTKGTISMTPKCCVGRWTNSFNTTLIFSLLFFVLPFLFLYLAAGFFIITFILYVFLSLVMACFIYYTIEKKQGVQFDLYARIAIALGFPGGERFDLLKNAGFLLKGKLGSEELSREIGNSPVPQPSRKKGAEYFYYY